MNIKISLIFFLMPFVLNGAMPRTEIGQLVIPEMTTFDQEEIVMADIEEKDLDELYNANAQNCGPAGTLVESGGVEGAMACMVKGFKNIYYGEYEDIVEFGNLSEEIIALLKIKQIEDWILITKDNINLVLFIPKLQVNALLLLKMFDEFQYVKKVNDYLMGYLLQYDESDIKKYFNDTYKGYTQEDIDNEFELNKKLALEWISKNAPTINEWAREKIKEGRLMKSTHSFN